MEWLLTVLGLIVGLAVGGAVAWVMATRRATARAESELLAANAQAAEAASEAMAGAERRQEQALALADAQHDARLSQATAELESRIAAADAQGAGLRDQLVAIQEEIKARRERDQAESAVLKAIAPVKDTIDKMQSRVEQLETQRAEQHAALTQQLADTRLAGEQIRQSAAQLREVMKSTNQRGRWGELQLRSVAEAAGMFDRVNFETQESIEVNGARYRPDMIVNLPGGKTIAVDSKVPFAAYLDAAEIPITASEAELARRDLLLKDHVKAVRAHVDALSGKRYWSGLENTPEMVVAFIPSESLLGAALEADPDVLEYAFSKHVALASPVTLFSVLKAIAVSWTHEEMSKEAQEVFEVSRTLYERLVTLAERVDKLGRSLTTSVKDYNEFVGTLERSVLPQARKIAKTSPSKVLPSVVELDANVRELTGSDLTQQLSLKALDFEIDIEDVD
jgi:DNA recombination protein RmuC